MTDGTANITLSALGN